MHPDPCESDAVQEGIPAYFLIALLPSYVLPRGCAAVLLSLIADWCHPVGLQ